MADKENVLRFRDEVLARHNGRVTQLYNNAGLNANGRLLHAPGTSADEIARPV